MVSIANTLAGALQTNIFAIGRIQSEIDNIQSRLSSGKRVGSALDNPTNFFMATSLSSRAARLSTVLDSISSKFSTLQQSNEALTSLTELAEQLKSTTEDAQQVLTDNPASAEITGNRNLSGITRLPVDLAGVDNNDRLAFSYVDTTGLIASSTVTIQNGDSTNDLITKINAITDTGANQVFEATLNSSGQLNITSQNAERFEIDFVDNGGGADSQLVSALGFGGFVTNEVNNGVSETRVTVSPGPSLTSSTLFDRSAGTQATGSTTLLNISDTSGGPAGDIFNGDANDAINISVDGLTAVTVVSDISTATVQDLVDGINNNGSLNTKIAASLDAGSGQINIRAINSNVESIQIGLEEDAAGAGTAGKIDLQQLSIGTQVLQGALDGNGLISSESISLGAGAGDLADLESEFNDLRTQIDELVNDAKFDDVNLLNGEDLVTIFNESGSSSLTTEGTTLSVTDLGISAANFGNSNNIAGALAEVNAGLATIETFSNALVNDVSVIETRQSFTEETIANLNTGSDNLTLVDEDAEGSLLLALQARKDLSVTVLGLSSEEQISVLRVF